MAFDAFIRETIFVAAITRPDKLCVRRFAIGLIGCTERQLKMISSECVYFDSLELLEMVFNLYNSWPKEVMTIYCHGMVEKRKKKFVSGGRKYRKADKAEKQKVTIYKW